MAVTNYPKVTQFPTVEAFREFLKKENLEIGLADKVPAAPDSALSKPIQCYGKKIGNRWSILPMEGWDCEADGAPSELTKRRWLRFAGSGAKLLCGTEAAAVMHSGRSNPYQLMVGLQLTHSGRYSHPNRSDKLEARTAWAHPLLDQKFHCGPENVVSDAEVEDIVKHFVHAAEIAYNAGFDFVDIKHAHGYLGYEFLTAYDRKGKYGGSFENRTRFFREIAEGI